MGAKPPMTEAWLLRDVLDNPGYSTARKPHYWLFPAQRQIYIVVWRAWWRGLITCPLFPVFITPAGRLALQESRDAQS